MKIFSSLQHQQLKSLFAFEALIQIGKLLLISLVAYVTKNQLIITSMMVIFFVELCCKTLLYRYALHQPHQFNLVVSIILALDCIILSSYLFFIGGATNALISFLLLPIAISAILLEKKQTWLICLLAIICYSLLMKFNLPFSFNASEHAHHSVGSSHFLAMWGTFTISALVLTVFVVSMAQKIQQQKQNIANYRQEQLRSEQIIAIGTASASAAHELATPLSTMQLVCDELELIDDEQERSEQLSLLQQQLARCQQILGQLRLDNEQVKLDKNAQVNAVTFFDTVFERWTIVRPDISITINNELNATLDMLSHPTLNSALMNLLDNAADASLENQINQITVKLSHDQRFITMDIIDQGPGVSPQLIQQLAQPKASNKQHGMGLGLFLANTSIERLHGQVSLTNGVTGAITSVTLPIAQGSAQ
ncbi:ATP-binding protein [Psychrobium sp. 1_MG-2023]|uniref:ATP-binding protein n=1 Tax=Psychrobium sp. 1_MG-2023 TaxID=3062624 RepID=UPI000C33C516|nr:ATP-binding protein [Psychrobium sp. 1_MG-2023]MDP2562613.1 ATP-binding protein [Psychrobium sp. 1_MG-2023]PKF54370.1 hypothetical protein CW748_16080 [Alteromonadales bacterium alter-6D02]